MRKMVLGLVMLLGTRAWAGPPADPFVGVAHGGNTVVGAGVPFGMVWAGPDTEMPSTSGYRIDQEILGFSQTHESGTGGFTKYGNFMVTPESGALHVEDRGSGKTGEVASPGYYAVTLTRSQVLAEMTATRRVGIHRYTFQGAGPYRLLLDASSAVFITEEQPPSQLCTDSYVRVSDRHMEGWGQFVGGWNPAPYRMYFAAEFSAPFRGAGTWRGWVAGSAPAARGTQTGGWATLAGRQVTVKVAVSFVSVAQARKTLLTEAPGWDFDACRARAAAAWDQALGDITVDGGTDQQRRMFYSALYHVFQMPHDCSGENAWWPSSEPHYEDFYCIWDTFRTVNPLLTLIEPQRERDMVRSLLDTFVHTGWLPDARIAGANGRTQGGSNGDVLVADAVVKGLGGFDLQTAWKALRKDAEVESPDPMAAGRVLADYHRLGYMSLASRRSASRTLEYAYDDFCVSEVAGAIGSDASRYLRWSRNWRNLWDEKLKVIRPRHIDGSWLSPYRREFSTGSWNGPFYEGSAWQYSTYVPHDVDTLIRYCGGDEAFVSWLDEFFESGNYTHDNEPDMLAAFLYIHAGRPDKTSARVRDILAKDYKPTPDGLPGNDDAGTVSAWYVWGAIGLYPNAGQPYYYLTAPIFPHSDVRVGNHRLVIDAPSATDENRYVVGAVLNGKPLDRAWIRHDEIAQGGHLELTLAAQPISWGQTERPPSPATER